MRYGTGGMKDDRKIGDQGVDSVFLFGKGRQFGFELRDCLG